MSARHKYEATYHGPDELDDSNYYSALHPMNSSCIATVLDGHAPVISAIKKPSDGVAARDAATHLEPTPGAIKEMFRPEEHSLLARRRHQQLVVEHQLQQQQQQQQQYSLNQPSLSQSGFVSNVDASFITAPAAAAVFGSSATMPPRSGSPPSVRVATAPPLVPAWAKPPPTASSQVGAAVFADAANSAAGGRSGVATAAAGRSGSPLRPFLLGPAATTSSGGSGFSGAEARVLQGVQLQVAALMEQQQAVLLRAMQALEVTIVSSLARLENRVAAVEEVAKGLERLVSADVKAARQECEVLSHRLAAVGQEKDSLVRRLAASSGPLDGSIGLFGGSAATAAAAGPKELRAGSPSMLLRRLVKAVDTATSAGVLPFPAESAAVAPLTTATNPAATAGTPSWQQRRQLQLTNAAAATTPRQPEFIPFVNNVQLLPQPLPQPLSAASSSSLLPLPPAAVSSASSTDVGVGGRGPQRLPFPGTTVAVTQQVPAVVPAVTAPLPSAELPIHAEQLPAPIPKGGAAPLMAASLEPKQLPLPGLDAPAAPSLAPAISRAAVLPLTPPPQRAPPSLASEAAHRVDEKV